MMRTRRIKIEGRGAVYHCISRVVGGDFLLKDSCKEQFKRMLWQQAKFCGIEVVTYCVMTNHFHVLVRVPESQVLSDGELLERVLMFYGEKVPWVGLLKARFESQGFIEQDLRDSLVSRMGDLSVFLKELKKRFSNWYNRENRRFGTLWAERFKSVLVEDKPSVVSLVAAYVDLNPVRAGIVSDPKDYRFSGYSEAVTGGELARRGILSFSSGTTWQVAANEYRKDLFVRGGVVGQFGKQPLSKEAVLRVLKEDGVLSRAALLRLRVRYMSDGAVLGSQLFVDDVFNEFRDRFSQKRKSGARKIRGAALGDVTSIRDLQVNVLS
jgi:putative transposase